MWNKVLGDSIPFTASPAQLQAEDELHIRIQKAYERGEQSRKEYAAYKESLKKKTEPESPEDVHGELHQMP